MHQSHPPHTSDPDNITGSVAILDLGAADAIDVWQVSHPSLRPIRYLPAQCGYMAAFRRNNFIVCEKPFRRG
ncbi:hypothetical protein CERSUDRAFT_119726, partial [Gelatoporia subvermispora B]